MSDKICLIKDDVETSVQLVEKDCREQWIPFLFKTSNCIIHNFDLMVGQTIWTSHWLRPTQTFTISGKTKKYQIKIVRKVATHYYRAFNFDNNNPDMIESYDKITILISNKCYDPDTTRIRSIIVTIKCGTHEETFEYTSKINSNDNTFVIIPKKSSMFHDSEQGVERFYSNKFIICNEKLEQNEYHMNVQFFY